MLLSIQTSRTRRTRLVEAGMSKGGVAYDRTHFVGCEPIPKRDVEANCIKGWMWVWLEVGVVGSGYGWRWVWVEVGVVGGGCGWRCLEVGVVGGG